MKLFDRVILSVDDNKAYYEHLPLVARSWRKFFPNVEIHLAFISNRGRFDEVTRELEKWVNILYLYPELGGVCTANTAKMMRYILASEMGDKICLIHDVDTCILQREYFSDLMLDYKDDHLIAVGHDVYYTFDDGKHSGKFPASSMTASGNTFKKLINPKNLTYTELFQSWANFFLFDEKESVLQPRNIFSDESLVRALIEKNKFKNVIKRDRLINTDTQWFCRSRWHEDLKGLNAGQYIEAHLPRIGMDEGVGHINLKPIKDYIYAR